MTKTLHGTIRGKLIELDQDPGISEGQEVEVEVRLVPTPSRKQPRKPGILRGTVQHMASDFDAPLDAFREYMP